LQAAFGDRYTVYESGVDVLKTPAVVINPQNPYMIPTTMGVDAKLQVFIDLWLVTNRTSPKDALRHLEEMRKTASDAIKTHDPRGRWSQFGQLGSTNVGGTPYATGVLQCVFVTNDNQTGV
jgi:ubiquitin C-terminal hydrolase